MRITCSASAVESSRAIINNNYYICTAFYSTLLLVPIFVVTAATPFVSVGVQPRMSVPTNREDKMPLGADLYMDYAGSAVGYVRTKGEWYVRAIQGVRTDSRQDTSTSMQLGRISTCFSRDQTEISSTKCHGRRWFLWQGPRRARRTLCGCRTGLRIIKWPDTASRTFGIPLQPDPVRQVRHLARWLLETPKDLIRCKLCKTLASAQFELGVAA